MNHYGHCLRALLVVLLSLPASLNAIEHAKVQGHVPERGIGASEVVTVTDPQGNATLIDELAGRHGCSFGDPNGKQQDVMWLSARKGMRGMATIKNISNAALTLENADPQKKGRDILTQQGIPGHNAITVRFASGENAITVKHYANVWSPEKQQFISQPMIIPQDQLPQFVQITFCKINYPLSQSAFDSLNLDA